MKRYRKKPVVIEAVQWDGYKLEGVYPITFFQQQCNWHYGQAPRDGDKYELVIETLEGEMCAEPGDYIIKDIKGEIYPCKPDIFEASYEEVK